MQRSKINLISQTTLFEKCKCIPNKDYSNLCYIYFFKCVCTKTKILHVEKIMLVNYAQNKLNLTLVLNKK